MTPSVSESTEHIPFSEVGDEAGRVPVSVYVQSGHVPVSVCSVEICIMFPFEFQGLLEIRGWSTDLEILEDHARLKEEGWNLHPGAKGRMQMCGATPV